MANPNLSELDLNQALKRTIDADADATRVLLASGTDFAIELDAADGDNVAIRSLLLSQTILVNSSSTGTIIAEFSVEGYKDFQLMAKNLGAITGTCTVSLQISPVASGDVWLASGVTLAIAGSADQLGSISNLLAKRARVVVSSNTISGGSADLYLMVRG